MRLLSAHLKSSLPYLIMALFLLATTPAEAQFMKKLKNKVNNAVNDIAGNEVEKELSLGTATISNSAHEDITVDKLGQTKVTKSNESTSITGSWRTHEADIFDGYSLRIGEAKDEIEGTYTIGNGNSFKIAYDPKSKTINMGPAVSKEYQNLEFTSGEVTISAVSANEFTLSFKGKADNDGESVAVSGKVNTEQVLIFDNRTKAMASDQSGNDQDEVSNFAIPGFSSSSDEETNLRDTYSFSQKIVHEVTTDNNKEKMKMAYLFSNEDYFGIGVDMSDYDEGTSGESFIVLENGETHMFINAGGMKMRMSQMPGGGVPIPEQEFNNPNGTKINKTGATKKILGYTCYEYSVKDKDTDSRFWVTPDLEVKNWMNFPENEIDGHILEYDVKSKDGSMKSVAVEVNEKANISIKSSEYPKRF